MYFISIIAWEVDVFDGQEVLLDIRHVAKTNDCETRNNYIQIFVKLVEMQLASFRIIHGRRFIPHY